MRVLTWIRSHLPLVLVILGLASVFGGALVAVARGNAASLLKTVFSFAPLIVVTAGGAITLVASTLDAAAKDRWTRIGGVVTLVGAVVAGVNQIKFERDTHALITGGDSYPSLHSSYGTGPTNDGSSPRLSWWLMLGTEGDAPVYDVQLVLVDLERQGQLLLEDIRRTGGRGISSLRAYTDPVINRRWKLGNLPAKALGPFFMELHLPDGDSQRYRGTATARNGQTFGEINFRKVNGRVASRRADRAQRACRRQIRVR